MKIDKYYLFSFILILLLFFTTNHYSYEQILFLNQLDSKSYYQISINSPNLIFDQDIPYHHYQRFIVPYSIGILSKLFGIEIFLIYKIFTFLTLIFISIIHNKIFIKLGHNFETSILLLSIIIFSPYLSRYIVSIPLMLIDLLFVLICYMVMYSYVLKSKILYILMQFSLTLRLSGIAIVIGYLFTDFKNLKKNLSKSFLIIFLSLIIIIILSLISKKFTNSQFSNLHYLGLIKEVNNNLISINTLIFLIKPIVNFIPLIFLFLFFNNKKNNLSYDKIIFFIFIPLMLIGQPVLGGVFVTGNNIFRISSLALPFFVVFFAIIYKPKIIIKKKYFYFLLSVNFLYSLHPKYSIVSLIIN